MKKLLIVLLCLNACLLADRLWQEVPMAQGGGGGPWLDDRCCADANGDGLVNIVDPITILGFLFGGEGQPHCVAQGRSPLGRINELVTRVQALEERTAFVGSSFQDSNRGDVAISTVEPTAAASVTIESRGGAVLLVATYNFPNDFPIQDAIVANIRSDGMVLERNRFHTAGVPSFWTAHRSLIAHDVLPATNEVVVYEYELTLKSELNPQVLPEGGASIIALQSARAVGDRS